MLAPSVSARGQTVDDPYNIMRPEPGTRQPKPVEPWLAPKYRSPRGSNERAVVPRQWRSDPPLRAEVPPPIYVPQPGRLLPNMPALPGAGPGGRETGQDRAIRCQHQAGVYGDATGNREAYVGGCINQ
ncbi:MAG: hypothetical protein Q7T81_10510 [Pseudolabrys sp.]|nr:hypothetical protein [Pseudolabrys sp.]